MATNVWQRTREGIMQLWRRSQPHRTEIIAAELETSREEAPAALTVDDQGTLNELRTQ
ncbi:hypothetical protein ACFVWX_02245 [Streptomyces sp. NPDC058220]|uniref:hypothetical protein n=1 Tax=Streptomyces sp. NPDC058220 TaxID=3346387 RepID=UPI0036E0CF8D